MNDFDKNSSNFWKFLVIQAKTQEFYGNSRPNFAKNSIFRQVQSPTMPKKWPKKNPCIRHLRVDVCEYVLVCFWEYAFLCLSSGFFFTIGKKTETKKLRILKKLRVIPAKKLRLSEALCNVPGPKNWDYRRPYLVSSAQKNSEYEKNSKLSTKNSACRRVGPTSSSKNLVKKKAW